MGAGTACPRCGTPVDQGAESRFCLECGADLSSIGPGPSAGPVPEPKPAPDQEHEADSAPEPEPKPGKRRNRTPIAAALTLAAALAIAAALGAMGSLPSCGDASGQASSSAAPSPSSDGSEQAASDVAEPDDVEQASSTAADEEPEGGAASSESSGGELKSNGVSLVGDVSGMSRDEVAKLFAMVATSSKVADGSGGYIDYESRDADMSKLLTGDCELRKKLAGKASRTGGDEEDILQEPSVPVSSERAFVMARDGDTYVVTADEELVGLQADAVEDGVLWGPRELVVVFGGDGLVEHAYDIDVYRRAVRGVEGADHIVYPSEKSEEEELAPEGDDDRVAFKTDDFEMRLPGPWKLFRYIPYEEDSTTGLANDTYAFASEKYGVSFLIGVNAFDLQSYSKYVDDEDIIGLTSRGKQVTTFGLDEMSEGMRDYLLEHIELK